MIPCPSEGTRTNSEAGNTLKTETLKTEKWGKWVSIHLKQLKASPPKSPPRKSAKNANKTAIPEGCESARHSSRFHFVPVCRILEQNGTLKSLAALLVCGVYSQSAGRKSALASFIARSSTRTSPRLGISPSTLRGPRMATAGNWPVQIERNVYDLQG